LDFSCAGIQLADGLEVKPVVDAAIPSTDRCVFQVTEGNRPTHNIANIFWDPSIEIKAELSQASLSQDEYRFLEKLVVHESSGQIPPQDLQSHRAVIPQLAKRLKRLAVNASRLPTYKENMERVLEEILSETGDLLCFENGSW